jgi:subtilisin
MKKRKVVGSVILSLTLGVSMFTSGVFGKEVENKEYHRVLIQGKQSERQVAKNEYGMRWDFNEEGFTTTVNEKQYQALLKNKNLVVKEVDQVSIDYREEAKAIPSITAASVPSNQTPWGIKAIYNDPSIQKTSGGNGIKVAVLDTGVNINHKDLAGSAEQCKDFSQLFFSLRNGVCTDRQGHGTHVAGTVLAHGGSDGLGVYGVAPEAKLWAYKVLNDLGSGYSDDIANAIRHAADEAVRTNSKVIISMSLGAASKNSLIANAVDYAYSKGALVVAAAGNSGSGENTIGFPGGLANAIAVAALENVQENGTYRVADYSSRGNPATDGDYVIGELDVEISAPGSAVESTWYNGSYNTISGTSMATPHVSGLAAKIWANNPTWSHSQLRQELQNRAKQNDIKGGVGAAEGDDYASGFGFARVQ